jgi:hypothetical protein
MICSFANGILLPFQVAFTIITSRTLPSNHQRKATCMGPYLQWKPFGSICKLPSNLWRKSWCFISSIKSNELKPQKIKRWCDYLTIRLSTRTKTFWNGWRRNILTFWWFLYLAILQLPFNQLILLCSIESNMHSKWLSTLGWEKWSRNKLTMEWIEKLIS